MKTKICDECHKQHSFLPLDWEYLTPTKPFTCESCGPKDYVRWAEDETLGKTMSEYGISKEAAGFREKDMTIKELSTQIEKSGLGEFYYKDAPNNFTEVLIRITKNVGEIFTAFIKIPQPLYWLDKNDKPCGPLAALADIVILSVGLARHFESQFSYQPFEEIITQKLANNKERFDEENS